MTPDELDALRRHEWRKTMRRTGIMLIIGAVVLLLYPDHTHAAGVGLLLIAVVAVLP